MPAPDVPLWDANKRNNNCYAFAFDHLRRGAQAKLQPGQLSGVRPLRDHEYTCHDLMARVVSDHPGVRVVGADDPRRAGEYRVALVVDDRGANRDYHFYREVAPGRWLHKPGSRRVSDVDDSGKPITDPRTADRDYVNDGAEADNFDYATYCGMFAVPATAPREAPRLPVVLGVAALALALAVVCIIMYGWARSSSAPRRTVG